MTIKIEELRYTYCLKTTDAELRGISELDASRFSHVASLPLFELTKSRKTRKSEHGDIEKRMGAIRDIVGDRPFILDLTSHADLVNPQIESMFDDSNGFENWRDFLGRNRDLSIIPAIHTYSEDFEAMLALEVSELSHDFDFLALRMSSALSPLPFLDVIDSVLGGLERLILVLDAEFVSETSIASHQADLSRRLDEIAALARRPGKIVVLSSSFPKSVTADERQGGEDDFGEFVMLEKELFQAVERGDLPVCYGDYASVHPKRYMARGGAWVPRVDLPLDDTYIYLRYRREAGGYVRAASEMVQSDWYDPVACWGADQIEAAASGTPNGRSPSFWIAVRINSHISRIIDAL